MVHVGVGGFHRSHQAFYTDQLLQSGDHVHWAICGVGLRKDDAKMQSILESQDYLYTLIIKHPDGTVEPHVIGSIVDFQLGCDDPGPTIEKMASPDTRIVSLTITEGGYKLDPSSDAFKHDIDNPDRPKLVFGFLTAALRRRRDRGQKAFTVLSCDNIQHNGNLTRKVLVDFAKRQNSELADWIDRNVCFPNSMVDRITPVTTDDDINLLKEKYAVHDRWPVTCEPFCQWVVEDCFSDGRPDWERVGVQFVPDVAPYEEMKLRLLNAGHSVLGILGSIHGHETIDQCAGDEMFVKFLRGFYEFEATPTLPPVEGIDLAEYKETLLKRFGNPNIRDSVSRICSGSSDKLPVFLIPTIARNLQHGGSIEYAALVIAAWCLYCDHQTDSNGAALRVDDAMKDELIAAANKTANDKVSFLRLESIFGDLAKNTRFTKTYETMIDAVYQDRSVTAQMRAINSDAAKRRKPSAHPKPEGPHRAAGKETQE
jgi:mannitol 2-dehydrogenase